MWRNSALRSSRSRKYRADFRIGHRRRCRDGAASRRDERAFLRHLPNLARAASTYSYPPDRSRGLIPTLALPQLRAGTPRRGFRLQSWNFAAGPLAEGDRGFESRSLQQRVSLSRSTVGRMMAMTSIWVALRGD